MSMLENFIWRSAWTLLTVLTVARVAYGVQFQSVGAVGPAMVQDLSLAYASLGTLVGAYSMLGVVLALPAGWLIAQLGDRRIVLAGLGFMILGGLLLAAAPGFPVALTGRLISGAGGGTAAGFPADDHHESLHRHRTLHRNGHDAGWLSCGHRIGVCCTAAGWIMADGDGGYGSSIWGRSGRSSGRASRGPWQCRRNQAWVAARRQGIGFRDCRRSGLGVSQRWFCSAPRICLCLLCRSGFVRP